MLTVEEAVAGRYSARAYLPDPVPRPLVERILTAAGRAPSGSNIQPWRVWVLQGAVKDEIVRDLMALHNDHVPEAWEYSYYPTKWREPYLGRRRACGFGLYATIGIAKGDKQAMHAQHGRNFTFFDAPVGLIFSIDRDMEIGSWLDYGMFLQSIMVVARQFGLETCPQAAFGLRHELLQKRLAIPAEQMVVCGMSLGYPDPDAKVNGFRTDRIPLSDFTTFVETLAPA